MCGPRCYLFWFDRAYTYIGQLDADLETLRSNKPIIDPIADSGFRNILAAAVEVGWGIWGERGRGSEKCFTWQFR